MFVDSYLRFVGHLPQLWLLGWYPMPNCSLLFTDVNSYRSVLPPTAVGTHRYARYRPSLSDVVQIDTEHHGSDSCGKTGRVRPAWVGVRSGMSPFIHNCTAIHGVVQRRTPTYTGLK